MGQELEQAEKWYYFQSAGHVLVIGLLQIITFTLVDV